jgi:hypothetical protein
MKNVLVIFQAATQQTESLALAFGLGAVQAGGNIRLRHLDPSPSVELAHAGYGRLRGDDLRWAEGVAIFLESAEMGDLKLALEEMAGDPPTSQKWALLFDAGSDPESTRLVRAMLLDRGFKEVLDQEIQEAKDDLSNSASVEAMTHTGQKFASIAAKEK